MMDNVAVRTIVPIFLLIGTGLLSRRLRILKAGDERVLSAYVHYFALPSLFFINLTEVNFTSETLIFTIAGVIPLFMMLMIYGFLYFIFRFSRNIFYLLTVSTVFGSLAFFGIPFISFAFPADGERLATLAAAFIAIVGVTTSLIIFELYKLEKSTKIERIKKVAKRLSKNPLIISILLGFFLSLVGIEIPTPISDSLHMLGSTTSIVAMFMLGVFLYGQRYTKIGDAFKLSFLRILVLPTAALLVTRIFGLTGVEGSVLVLMHSMPIAISMIALSQRYNSYEETIASVILVSSLSATMYLNLWLLLLGYY